MAKRFTDNEKWKDAWFMDLPSKYKLFWLYLLDECNHAGIWKVNFKVAAFHIGEHLEYSEVKRMLNSRITILDDEYWYINKFIKYQYKCDIEKLNPKNKAHLSVIKMLNEFQQFKPLTSPLLGVKDKDMDKDMDKEIITTTEKIKNIDVVYEAFVKEIKEGMHQQWAEQTYMQLGLKKGSLTTLLKNFKSHLIRNDTCHNTVLELKKHLNNWLNNLDSIGKLNEFKKNPIGAL